MRSSASARTAILHAVEAALGSRKLSVDAVRAEALALLSPLDPARPAYGSSDVVESFVQRVGGPKVGATVERIPTIDELPAAVARYVAAGGRNSEVTLQPTRALTNLDWKAAGLGLGHSVDDCTVVGFALWGVAETGSLIFHSGADTPILYNFLPAVHIVGIPAACIVWHLEDYATAARLTGQPPPRNVCFITGASGTTDIEGALVKGAHGPGELHVVVIERHE
jgi:L-lactate dehydrogenase complex protein LldG